MDKNIVDGKIKQAEGKVEDVAGNLSGNLGEEAKGKLKQAAGKVQEELGKASDAIRTEVRKANADRATE